MKRNHDYSPHKFTPMPGVHKAIEWNVEACHDACWRKHHAKYAPIPSRWSASIHRRRYPKAKSS